MARKPSSKSKKPTYTRKFKKYGKKYKKKSYPDGMNIILNGPLASIYNSTTVNLPASNYNVQLGSVIAQGNSRYQFGGALSFGLTKCVGFEERLAPFYDRYKINKISVRFIPSWNMADVVGGGQFPVMRITHDWDDSTPPTVGDMEVRRAKSFQLLKPFSYSFVPKVATNLYQPGATSAYVVTKAPWINMAYRNVPHYGLKFSIRDWYCTNAPNTLTLRIETRYYISVKEQLQLNKAPSLLDEDASGNEILIEEREDADEIEPCAD